ncbi:type III-B CRISPR module RAMP protein Cmr1 [Crassaminicella indica]|uniref:Type III-B CRISPR module RAMP protein Cmr1 n=1 Tax=Crassaminicella indica TaxID=2855394 RepID=A0ABX8R8L4_9CLOT|nr:type III-B CRISPR module RAMP protein Cmr1 [Crassaminicella indica]QXM05367.1 type III-B CRISPR module RAMP protein Cmr1 [Crassaminicella indica]
MKKVKINLEIVTHMLSFGNNTEKPEFRIPELKALMRNIFRELYDFKDVDDMKNKEEILFGSLKKKSPISLKLKSMKVFNEEVEVLPHKKSVKMKAIPPKTKVTLYMFGRDEEKLDMYMILLILSSIIGSLGRRSRKGFGSFKIIRIEGEKESQYKEYGELISKSAVDIFRKLEEICCDKFYKMRKIDIYKDKHDRLSIVNIKDFSNKYKLNYPYAEKIHIIKIEKNIRYKELIKYISKLTHDRLCFNIKGRKDFREGIPYKYRVDKNILGNYRSNSRFAAPVVVSFWENSKNKYLILKELNINYQLQALCKQENKGKKQEEKYSYKEFEKANISYVDKYINKLIYIAKGEKK